MTIGPTFCSRVRSADGSNPRVRPDNGSNHESLASFPNSRRVKYSCVFCTPQTYLAFGFLISDSRRWHLQANDNSLSGWLATGIYVILIILCWREVLRPQPAGIALQRPFWVWLSLGVTAV